MFGKRFSRALAVTTVASLVMATAAFADTVVNTIDNSVDNTLESMALTAGGAGGSTLIFLRPTNNNSTYPDSSGCNLGGQLNETLTVAAASGNTAVATVSLVDPSDSAVAKTTFTDCTEFSAGTTTLLDPTAAIRVLVTPIGAGSTNITISGPTSTSRGNIYYTPAHFAVNVSPGTPSCTTPAQPTINATGGTTGSNGWYKAAPTLSTLSAGVQWATAVNGGIKSSFSSAVPTLGVGTTIVYAKAVDGTCQSTEASATFKVDPNAPTIVDNGIVSGTAGTGTWYITPVEHEFEASEPLIESGIPASMTNPFTGSTGATSEGTGLTIPSGPVSDVAGNTNPGITSLATYDVDLSNPYNVAFVGGPAAGSSHFFGSVPAAPTCTADDDISGLARCLVTGWSDTVGSHTMTATATDNAGRTATQTRSYSVLAWTLNGFYSPVDMNSALNVVKAGSTVPLKFEIFAGSTEFTTIDKVASFKVGKVPCGALNTTLSDDIENYSTGQTVLRYDSTGGQFIQNWQVPKASASAPAGSCYTATLTTLDGSSLTAYFKTK